MENLQLLMQYLSGAGAAMSQGESIAPALNQITQQSIASQSYAGLLQQILGGGGKMTLDKDKFSLTGSPDLLGPGKSTPEIGPGSAGRNPVLSGAETPQVTPAPTSVQPQQNDSIMGAGNLGFLQQLLNPKQAL